MTARRVTLEGGTGVASREITRKMRVPHLKLDPLPMTEGVVERPAS